MIAPPTFDQISQLPVAKSGEVEEPFIDDNGHMNVGDYFRLTMGALWEEIQAFGADLAYIRERNMSLFTVEQHIRYFGEMRLGEPFTLHNRFIGRSSRVVHAMTFLLDQSKQSLACSMEISWVHVDMTTRRSADLPGDVTAGIDASIARSTALDWLAPISGAMGVRG